MLMVVWVMSSEYLCMIAEFYLVGRSLAQQGHVTQEYQDVTYKILFCCPYPNKIVLCETVVI